METNPYRSPVEAAQEVSRVGMRWRAQARTAGLAFAGLLVLAVLWFTPIAAFHHMELYGLFGWLFVNGEDPDPASWFYIGGVELAPTCGLIPTAAATALLGWSGWKLFLRTKANDVARGDDSQ